MFPVTASRITAGQWPVYTVFPAEADSQLLTYGSTGIYGVKSPQSHSIDKESIFLIQNKIARWIDILIQKNPVLFSKFFNSHLDEKVFAKAHSTLLLYTVLCNKTCGHCPENFPYTVWKIISSNWRCQMFRYLSLTCLTVCDRSQRKCLLNESLNCLWLNKDCFSLWYTVSQTFLYDKMFIHWLRERMDVG